MAICRDFADAYPSCEVIGTDISPTQPPWAPPNLRFEMDDFAAVPVCNIPIPPPPPFFLSSIISALLE